jgi:hypothetical protein
VNVIFEEMGMRDSKGTHDKRIISKLIESHEPFQALMMVLATLVIIELRILERQ